MSVPALIKKGNLVHQFGTWGPDFTLAFELRINSPTSEISPTAWYNLFHFTANDRDCCEYGDRLPSVYLRKSTVNANGWQFHTSIRMPPLKTGSLSEMVIGQWHKIKLAWKENEKKDEAIFTETIDGKVLESWKTEPTQYHNVKWYQSNPWYPSAGNLVNLQNFTIEHY